MTFTVFNASEDIIMFLISSINAIMNNIITSSCEKNRNIDTQYFIVR